jgi:hypothetical protein
MSNGALLASTYGVHIMDNFKKKIGNVNFILFQSRLKNK